tara:strand:+ start:3020 stop:3307 length:288 start_codon:yes stop_codon:yes gene_type:complete
MSEESICPKEEDCVEELKLPGMLDMAKNLIRDGVKITSNAISGNSTLVDDSVRELRIKTCRECPQFTPDERCVECGCFMKIKVAFVTSKCPIGKW